MKLIIVIFTRELTAKDREKIAFICYYIARISSFILFTVVFLFALWGIIQGNQYNRSHSLILKDMQKEAMRRDLSIFEIALFYLPHFLWEAAANTIYFIYQTLKNTTWITGPLLALIGISVPLYFVSDGL